MRDTKTEIISSRKFCCDVAKSSCVVRFMRTQIIYFSFSSEIAELLRQLSNLLISIFEPAKYKNLK